MTNLEIAQSIRNGMFAERKTLKEAVDYAIEVFDRLGPSGNIAATTALMVVLNTISNEIIKNEQK